MRAQPRKSFSVRGTTYDRVVVHCAAEGISLSHFCELVIAEKLGYDPPPAPKRSPPSPKRSPSAVPDPTPAPTTVDPPADTRTEGPPADTRTGGYNEF